MYSQSWSRQCLRAPKPWVGESYSIIYNGSLVVEVRIAGVGSWLTYSRFTCTLLTCSRLTSTRLSFSRFTCFRLTSSRLLLILFHFLQSSIGVRFHLDRYIFNRFFGIFIIVSLIATPEAWLTAYIKRNDTIIKYICWWIGSSRIYSYGIAISLRIRSPIIWICISNFVGIYVSNWGILGRIRCRFIAIRIQILIAHVSNLARWTSDFIARLHGKDLLLYILLQLRLKLLWRLQVLLLIKLLLMIILRLLLNLLRKNLPWLLTIL
mmetsp:Transcript_7751/g.12108  ORF Transcript_7751/g.12108 Transcript_7751/m.12108 type:complete len:265 (+) Transcript_7751:598-1392(+)